MTEVEEFIDNFLQHKYDPGKAREYYLRTRKLKGRSKSTKVSSKVYDVTPKYSGPPKSEQEKVARLQERLLKARKDAQKKKGNKLQEFERKLDSIEKKLQKKLQKKLSRKINDNLPASVKRAQKRAEEHRKKRLEKDREFIRTSSRKALK